MDYIPWSEYYKKWEGKKPLNEIIANYNIWQSHYEMYLHSLWLNSGGYNIESEEETSNSFLVVGAWGDDDEGSLAGAVYVYDATDLSAPPTKLAPSALQAGDRFGTAVAATDNQIIVGAPYDDTVDSAVGAIYVFDITDLSASPTKIVPPALLSDMEDRFGDAVAATNTQIVVGAEQNDSQGNQAGAVYVYDATDLSAPPTKLAPSALQAGDRFGDAVAATNTQIVVGAYATNSSAGAVYVYDASDLSISPTKLEISTSSFLPPYFGISVAAKNDKIVVGAPRESENFNFLSGAVYIYNANNLSEPPIKIESPDPTSPEGFGSSVAITDNQLLVGKDGESSGGSQMGAVFVYDLNDISADPVEIAPLELDAGDYFGYSVSATNNKIIVGAYRDDDGGSSAGAVYVYDATDLSAPPTKIVPNGIEDGDLFGVDVSIS